MNEIKKQTNLEAFVEGMKEPEITQIESFELGLCAGILAPHIIPSEARHLKEINMEGFGPLLSKVKDVGFVSGGILGLIGTGIAYLLAAEEGYPEVLLIPAITNGLSFAYESGPRRIVEGIRNVYDNYKRKE